MTEEYFRLLDQAMEKVPRKISSGERFEIPTPEMHTTGGRTTIYNFGEICGRLNRDGHHVVKFLSKEMATAGTLSGGRAVFQGRFNPLSIRRLLDIYGHKYVICPICGRPDTKMQKEGRFLFLVCEACGAKSSVLPM
jgi:translation initiation factor 2 subunit 2